MAEMKIKPANHVAGKSKFRLPERTLRMAEINPLRELLQEARAQEAAMVNESIDKEAITDNEPIYEEAITVNEPADKEIITDNELIYEETSAVNESDEKEHTFVSESIDKDAASAVQIAEVPHPIILNQAAETAPSQVAAEVIREEEVKPPFSNEDLFKEFVKNWASSLRCGQMKVCEALFKMTYGISKRECFTSMPKLAAAAGLKERQCYTIVAKLENLGFVERTNIYNTPDKKGTIFRLNLTPQVRYGTGPRYHIGSKDANQ